MNFIEFIKFATALKQPKMIKLLCQHPTNFRIYTEWKKVMFFNRKIRKISGRIIRFWRRQLWLRAKTHKLWVLKKWWKSQVKILCRLTNRLMVLLQIKETNNKNPMAPRLSEIAYILKRLNSNYYWKKNLKNWYKNRNNWKRRRLWRPQS